MSADGGHLGWRPRLQDIILVHKAAELEENIQSIYIPERG
jgi:hypothetical protein